MIFFLSAVKQVRIDTYCFRLILALVISQVEYLVFVFDLRLHIVPDVTRNICKWILIEGLKKSKTFWVSVLVEAGAAQDNGSCISPTLKHHLINGKVHYSLRLISVIFSWWKLKRYVFTACFFLHLIKSYSSHLKKFNVKIKVG